MFYCNYSSRQDFWKKSWKSRKIGEDQKTLTSALVPLLTTSTKVLILEKRLSNLLRLQVSNNLPSCKATCVQASLY